MHGSIYQTKARERMLGADSGYGEMTKEGYQLQVRCANCLAVDVVSLPFGKKFFESHDDQRSHYISDEPSGEKFAGRDLHKPVILECKNCGLGQLERYGAVV